MSGKMSNTVTEVEEEEGKPLLQPSQPSAGSAKTQPLTLRVEEPPATDGYGYASNILSTRPEEGLTSAEVDRRLAEFGENKLDEKKENMFIKLLKELFLEPMPIVVWAAIFIEAIEAYVKWPGQDARSSLIDVFVLLLLQFLNVFVAFFEELSAQENIDALQGSLPETANVVRDGVRQAVRVTQLVPGDIVHMESGEVIPADIEILPTSKPFRVNTSAMTGESKSVQIPPGADTLLCVAC